MKNIFNILIVLLSGNLIGQTVNGYANVSVISGTTLTVNSLDESSDTFEDGESVIIMQMQDDVIGANTGDNASFGLLGSIASAGLYEVRTILTHTESSGLPNTITLNAALSNTFNIGSNSSVQIITFPKFGSPNYTSGNMNSKAWDGTTGGVVAFYVDGDLTIGGNINADQDGFRGANLDAGASTGCSGGANYITSTGANFADKGEGIFKRTLSTQAAGQGHILTGGGGGGGNSHNAGGGGGGNYSAGGQGGPGWSGATGCSPSGGGFGGISLSSQISGSRIFLGGGGGSGEGNNGGPTDGGDGGGIIIIMADKIETTGSCGSGYEISSIGESIIPNGSGDGLSGGGAGGTILIQVNTWDISASCPLTIQANGGDGGTVTHGALHGGGGGGGQGAIIYSIAIPVINTTSVTNNGAGGLNCTSCGSAGSGGGSNNAGVSGSVIGSLPVELINYNVSHVNGQVIINWETLSELNNAHFIIEKSQNGMEWFPIKTIIGAGNSSELNTYQHIDYFPFDGLSYYRLKQVDFDEKFTYSDIKSIKIKNNQPNISIFPNPTNDKLTVEGIDINTLKIFDLIGRDLTHQMIVLESTDHKSVLDLSGLQNGAYLLTSISFSTIIFKE